MTEFDPDKPFRLRNGREARLMAKINNDEHPLVVLIKSRSGAETVEMYKLSGKIWNDGEEYPSDLVNIPERHSVWMNIYDDSAIIHETQSEAAERRSKNCIACIHVEFEEGEGL